MSNPELRDLLKRVGQLEMQYSRGSMMIREAAMPIVRSPSGLGDETDSSNCCCDELDCLDIPDGLDPEDILPAYYKFMATGFDCGCENNAGTGEIRLYQADLSDDTIWESDVFRCIAPAGATVNCTVTSTWSWHAAINDWDFVSDDSNGCGCTPVKPAFSGTSDGQTATTTCDTTKVADGETDLADFIWRLTIIEALDYYGCDQTKLELLLAE